MQTDFKRDNLWVKSSGGREASQKTLSGAMWSNMTMRCKDGGSYQKLNPSYVGCKMSSMFSDFQLFTEWHRGQIGYGLPSYDLDKDLLGDGKSYNEFDCVIIPHSLNAFFKYNLGENVNGVYVDKRRGTLYSKIQVNGKQRRLGSFTDPDEAKAAFAVAKLKETLIWLQRLENKEFDVDLRVVEKIRLIANKLSKGN